MIGHETCKIIACATVIEKCCTGTGGWPLLTRGITKSKYRIRSQEIAGRQELRYKEIPGDNSLVKKLLNGPCEGEFIVAPPGHTVTLSDFRQFQVAPL
jgi:hypothetical protein